MNNTILKTASGFKVQPLNEIEVIGAQHVSGQKHDNELSESNTKGQSAPQDNSEAAGETNTGKLCNDKGREV